MIKITRLNGKEFYVNADLIEFIEETPDTVMTLTTEKKVVVKESAPEIIKRIVEYRKMVFSKLPALVKDEAGE